MKAKKQKRSVGDVAQIILEDGSCSFARVLEEPLMAFYNRKADEVLSLEEIVSSPIAFKVWVMNSAITSGRWKVIGNVPLEPALSVLPKFFKQDPISKRLSITLDGKDDSPATREECDNLERAVVWSAVHIEDRLRDFYNNVPNKWVNSLMA